VREKLFLIAVVGVAGIVAATIAPDQTEHPILKIAIVPTKSTFPFSTGSR